MKRLVKILIVLPIAAVGGIILSALFLNLTNLTGVPEKEVDWLTTLNSYRISSGVSPVKESVHLSEAAQNHADYLALTDQIYLVGKYQNLHNENPKSPYASKDGATIGAGVIAWTKGKNASAVDQLMTAPFHAIGMLRENLVEVGFGTSVAGKNAFSSGDRITNIGVLQGLKNKSRKKVILFPGPNFVTHLNSFAGENPEPREACGSEFNYFFGLPIFASLMHTPSDSLKVSLETPSGKILSAGPELCVVTENNFRSKDLIYGPAGKSIIRTEHLVLIIPKSPLSEGEQKIKITEKGRPVLQWSFSYKAPELKF
jgi:hypothetical protein